MLSLNSHKRKTLHSRTEANGILHKEKRSITGSVFTQIPLLHDFLFLILLGVDVDLLQISKQNHSPIASPFQGNGKCIPFTCSFCGHQGFLSMVFLWIPFGLSLARVCRSGWKTALLLIKAYHFIRSHTFTESDLPVVPGVFKSYINPGQLDHCPVFSPWLEVTGLRKKRNRILSISAENIWCGKALCFLSYEKLINIQWLKVNTPFILFTLHPAHSSDCSNFNS